MLLAKKIDGWKHLMDVNLVREAEHIGDFKAFFHKYILGKLKNFTFRFFSFCFFRLAYTITRLGNKGKIECVES